MKLILDHCVPRPLIRFLPGHDIQRAGQMGWAELKNGNLLDAAQAAGFAALITVDKGFATQQNLAGRTISVLLLDSRDTDLDSLVPLVPALEAAIVDLMPGTLVRVGSETGE